MIDVVLGREAAASAAAAGEANNQAPAAMSQLGSTAARNEKDVEADLLPDPNSPDREQGEPVAYTEQGTSTWAALETGSLVNRKV